MAILVTGGAGYVGSQIVHRLIADGEALIVLDDLSTGHDWAVPDRVRLVIGDVGDGVLLERLFRAFPIETVVHAAGSAAVPESVVDPLGYYLNNTVKSRELIAAAVAARARHMIFLSSAAVYGLPRLLPVTEAIPLDPVTPYGAANAMTERMLDDAGRSHGLKHVVLRLFNVAGADPEGRAGPSAEGGTQLVKVAVEAALGRRPHVPVFGTDFATTDGTAVRDYVHVSDVADAVAAALRHLGAGGESLALNCGAGRGVSVLEVLDAAQRVSGTTLDIRPRAPRAGDVPELVASIARIGKALSWRPRHVDIETIVAHAQDWEKRLIERRVA